MMNYKYPQNQPEEQEFNNLHKPSFRKSLKGKKANPILPDSLQPFGWPVNPEKEKTQFARKMENKFKQTRRGFSNTHSSEKRTSLSSTASYQFKKQPNKSQARLNQEPSIIKTLALEAQRSSRRVLNILNIYQEGGKYSLQQTYIIVQTQNNSLTAINNLKLKIKAIMSWESKYLYLFHLNREPIVTTSEIHSSEYSLFVDKSPKLNIPMGLHNELKNHIKIFEGKIKNAESQVSNKSHRQILYIDEFVDQLLENPLTKIQTNYKDNSSELDNIIQWYENNGAPELSVHKTRHQSPLPEEKRSNIEMLKEVRMKLESFDFIKNQHQYKNPSNETKYKSLQLKERGREGKSKQVRRVRRNIKSNTPSLLSSQNIPYLIEKYNTTRFDVYNMYSLYQTLVQISLERNTEKRENRIDQSTFDQGMEGFGLSVGKQATTAVCKDDMLISWEEFLKIVSISLSKTPEQKLEYILQFLCNDSNSSYLSRLQIDLMVSSCLGKLLGNAQQNTFDELKQYLLDVIFKELDPTNLGKISISVLKERVTKTDKENDLISFLFLNSK